MPKKKVKKQKTYVALVLDRSSSMTGIRQEIIDGFNDHVKILKDTSKDMENRVSLTTFATYVDEPQLWNVPVNKLHELTQEDYNPCGSTAMLDAVGDTIDRLEKLEDINDENVAVLMLVISDGEENNSQKETYESIAERMKSLTDAGNWTVTYLGSNQDLTVVSKRANIHLGNTMSFESTPHGTRMANAVATQSLDSFMGIRSEGVRCVSNYYAPNITTGGTPGPDSNGPIGTIPRVADLVIGPGVVDPPHSTGKYIKNLKDSLGINQEDIARSVKTTQATVSRWASGKSQPRSNFVDALEKLRKS